MKFKEIIIDYKLFKEGNYCDLSDGLLVVTSLHSKTNDKNGEDEDDSYER